MNLLDDDDEVKTIIVVGMLTREQTLALVGEHPQKCLMFYTTEEEAETLNLPFSWDMVSEVWCATPQEDMPPCLARIVVQAERLTIPVLPSLEHIERAA